MKRRTKPAVQNQAAAAHSPSHFADLVSILQLAYSGELAAARAYNGHWRSLRDEDERHRIRQIEEEEWRHRRLVGDMLAEIGASPDPLRERRAGTIGSVLAILCRLSGWFAPMYAAGRLESRNIREYESAARFAVKSGWDKFTDCLLAMAEVEWDHERYFRARVLSHPLSSIVRLWPAPPPRESIRASFATEIGVAMADQA